MCCVFYRKVKKIIIPRLSQTTKFIFFYVARIIIEIHSDPNSLLVFLTTRDHEQLGHNTR